MKYKEWMRLIHKYPCKDLNGKVIAYDTDGTALGEVIFKEGKVISRKKYTIEEKMD
jgi:antitoxin component YwqK of YwqJK toxin-antitoxin module